MSITILKMMYDVMPTISEDSDGLHASDNDGASESSKFEQLMVNMLDERDKLVEQLHESQRRIDEGQQHLKESEKEKESLKRQLEMQLQPVPQEYQTLTKELNHLREQLLEKEEEIVELKAERNNTRLLLEHLECLVSRHERSLRMTVVKRQAQSPAGVSSEVEVLKALKSLFEHHKALDEKVRERLRVAMERVATLEDDIQTANQDNVKLKEQLTNVSAEAEQESLKDTTASNSDNKKQQQRISNGSIDADSSAAQVVELQEVLDKSSRELKNSIQRYTDLKEKISGLEDTLSTTQKEFTKLQDFNKKLTHELNEANAVRKDQDEMIGTLEKRYLATQRESACYQDLNDNLEQELSNKDANFRLSEEKMRNLQERLELAEQQLAQSLKRAESLPSVEAELQQRLEALSVAEQKHLSAEERIGRMEQQVEEKQAELQRALQREKMNEDHNQRLSATVDKLLSESNDRLQLHLKERLQALEEKNRLTQDVDHTRKLLDQCERIKDRFTHENEGLRQEVDALRDQLYALRTSQFNTRMHVNGTGAPTAAFAAPPVPRRIQKGRLIALENDPGKVQTLNEQEWDRIQQSNILATVQHAFSTSTGVLAAPGQTQPASMLVAQSTLPRQLVATAIQPPDLSPVTAVCDTQSLVAALQDQLDAINREIRLIHEEKQNAEMRAEEIENRVKQRQPYNNIVASQSAAYSNSMVGHITPRPIHQHTQQQSFVKYNTLPANTSLSQYYHQFGAEAEASMAQMCYDDSGFNYNDELTLKNTSLPYQFNRQRGDNFIENVGIIESGTPTMSATPHHHHQHSPTSSAVSSQDSLLVVTGRKSQGSLVTSKKRSTSASGLNRTLGRLFGKREKSKHLSSSTLYRTSNECATTANHAAASGTGTYYSDSEVSSGEPSMGFAATNTSAQPAGVISTDFDRRKRKKHELLEEAMKARTPFALWNGPTIVAWLELWVGMPAWYVAACRANVKSGAIMSALSDQEIQREIGISNPLHRLKLRLAIQEMVSLTSPSAPKTTRTTLAFGDMNHEWIGNDWLPSLGLPQYRSAFMESLVDARMLEHLTKKDLRTHLKMVDSFHRASLQYGIMCLKKLNYDRKVLDERRLACETGEKDVLVWSNDRVMRWLESVGLGQYVDNLHESAVHGAVFALDDTFDANALALTLQVPNNDAASRQVLGRQFSTLLVSGTDRCSPAAHQHHQASFMLHTSATSVR